MSTSLPWSLVLAGGDASRWPGVPVPRQYCSLGGGPSLVRLAVERAGRVSAWSRITAVVCAQHRPFWEEEIGDLPGDHVVVQPGDRGTGPAVLLPLLKVVPHDADETLVVIPADHFVADEDVLERAMRAALDEVRRRPDVLVVLGMSPEDTEPSFGWIFPDVTDRRPVRNVDRLAEIVRDPFAGLIDHGALWSSFICVGRVGAILRLYQRRLPGLFDAMLSATDGRRRGDSEPVTTAYHALRTTRFSRDLLQGAEDRLAVLPVETCGWSDLRTPSRVRRSLLRMPCSPDGRRQPAGILHPPLTLVEPR